MSRKYMKVDPSTGEITGHGAAPDIALAQSANPHRILVPVDDYVEAAEFHYRDGALRRRDAASAAEYVAQKAAKDALDAERKMRSRRNARLAESDWTQLPDAPLSEAEKAQWRAYRQQLRDLPQAAERPERARWPEPPDMRKRV